MMCYHQWLKRRRSRIERREIYRIEPLSGHGKIQNGWWVENAFRFGNSVSVFHFLFESFCFNMKYDALMQYETQSISIYTIALCWWSGISFALHSLPTTTKSISISFLLLMSPNHTHTHINVKMNEIKIKCVMCTFSKDFILFYGLLTYFMLVLYTLSSKHMMYKLQTFTFSYELYVWNPFPPWVNEYYHRSMR